MENYRAIPEGYMRIGEMAKKTGTTVRTLQFYHEEGLLTPSAESDGGFRLYSDRDMVRLIQILMLKQLGFGLGEIKKRLTQLDTPEDVIKMLTEQAAQVRKKIEALTESLVAMEALSDEIAQMESVNFKKYADILLNLQVKNESYRLIKHFDDDVLEELRERIGNEKAAMMTATLNDLYKQAAELSEKNLSPESGEGQKFADKFWQKFVELSDGDTEIMFKITEQMERATSLQKENTPKRATVRKFMMRAMQTLLGVKHGKIFFLYREAVRLMEEGVPPESEGGQNFAANMQQAIDEITGGDPEKIRQLQEKSEKAGERFGKNDKEYVAVQNYMRQAMEIYHSGGKKT